jgi:hypothetical protein
LPDRGNKLILIDERNRATGSAGKHAIHRQGLLHRAFSIFLVDEITEAFDRHGVATLKGDWTNRDPQITRLLEEYGRSGVPLYLWYPAGHQGPGEILPQILTRSRVLEALSSQKVAK